MKGVVFILFVLSASALHLKEAQHGSIFPTTTSQVLLKSDLGTYLTNCPSCESGMGIAAAI